MISSLLRKTRRSHGRRSSRSAFQQRHLSGLEKLEDRIVFNTYWASNLEDSGAGSLRDAIDSANGHTGADDVRFREEMKGTITLSSELSITDSLAIHGRGSDKLTVSGGGTTRVVNIAAGADVTIEHLTIANGFVRGEDGAGILNQGNLQLLDSVVSDNSATTLLFVGGDGGGIKSFGNLAIQRSQIMGNTAFFRGGGVWNLGNASIEDSQIDNNYAQLWGGGLSNTGTGSVTLDHVLVTKNITHSDGAGIHSVTRGTPGTTLTIADSTISDNSSSHGAGGVYSHDKELTIRDTKIHGNSSGENAGGITIFTTDNVLISRSEITENVGGVGGIKASVFRGKSRIEDTTISNNVAGFIGGIVHYGNAPFEIVRSTISGNQVIVPNVYFSPLVAGGIRGGVQLVNSTISGNTVDATNDQYSYNGYDYPSWAAGGIIFESGTSVENSTITNNQVFNAPITTQSTGGLLGFFSTASIRNSIVARNESVGGDADVSGSFVSQGHNLIGILGASATGFVASDLRGTSDAPLDPLLEALADNGGWTKTHMLRRGSPAIDAGDSSNSPASDQRGYVRVIGDAIDIGSVEWKSHPLDPQELAQMRWAQTVLSAVGAGTAAEQAKAAARMRYTRAACSHVATCGPHVEGAYLDDARLQPSVVDDLYASLTADGL